MIEHLQWKKMQEVLPILTYRSSAWEEVSHAQPKAYWLPLNQESSYPPPCCNHQLKLSPHADQDYTMHICFIKPGKMSVVAMKNCFLAGKRRQLSLSRCLVPKALSNALCLGAGACASSFHSSSYPEAEHCSAWILQLPNSSQKSNGLDHTEVPKHVHWSICCKLEVWWNRQLLFGSVVIYWLKFC